MPNRFDTTIAAQPACGDYGSVNAIKFFVAINCFGYPRLTSATPDDPRIVGTLVRDNPTRVAQITDGLSNSILIAEDAGRSQYYISNGVLVNNPQFQKEGGWADPNGTFSIDGSNPDGSVPGPCSLNCSNNSEIYSFHTDGANVVFADGSVHFLHKSIDLCMLSSLVTRAGGEVVDQTQY